MSLRNIVMAAAGAAGGVNVEELFATATYSGNGSTQNINNGLDMSGNDSALWIATRSGSPTIYAVLDAMQTNGDGGALEFSSGGRLSNGFALAADGLNDSGDSYVSWSFVEAAGFFSKTTYTGNGATSRSISHALGQTPGMVILKRTDSTGAWAVHHRGLSGTEYALRLNLSGQEFPYESGNFTLSSATVDFASDIAQEQNINGASYTMYTFAHNTSGAIQCGSFTTDGSGNGSFNHGWSEGAQFVMLKARSTSGDWEVYDTVRDPAGWGVSDDRIRINTSNGEDSVSRLSDSSGTLSFTGLSASATYIVMLVRAPAS